MSGEKKKTIHEIHQKSQASTYGGIIRTEPCRLIHEIQGYSQLEVNFDRQHVGATIPVS